MPDIRIRWADNTPELTRHLKEGLDQIEATKAGAEKMVQALGGDKLMRAAHTWVAAVGQMGGAEKLTNAERERGISLLERAIEKYRVLGKEAPTALLATLQQTKALNQPLSQMVAGMTAAGQQATASGRMLAGMGVSGQAAMAGIAKSTATTVGPMTSMLGLAKSLGPALGIGFGVGAVVNFGRAVLADADALTKMHDKTGISVEGLQKFQIVADDAGNTLEQLTTATNQLQNRLAGNDKSAVAAVEKLGLNLADLKRMRPEDQFMTIADAIRQIEDPAEQVNVAMDLFGRSGAEILPTIKRGFDDVKDSAVGMSAETVKALDDAGDAWDRYWRRAKGLAATGLGFGINMITGDATGREITQRINRETSLKMTPLEQATLHRPVASATPLKDNEGNPISVLPIQSILPPPGIPEDLDHITKSLSNQREEWNALRKTADEAARAIARDAAEAWEFVQRSQAAAMGEAVTSLQRGAAGQPDFMKKWQAAQFLREQTAGTVRLDAQPFGPPSIAGQMAIPGAGMESLRALQPGLTAGLSDVFKTAMPQAILSAFQGGGSPIKSIGSLLGSQLGTNLVSKVGGSITGLLGKTVGGALNAVLPGIGSLIGPGISALLGGIKKLFGGASEAELKGRKESFDFQDQITKTLTAQQRAEAGGVAWKMTMIGVRDAYIATGRSAAEAERVVQALFDTKNPEAYKRAMQEIQGVMDEQQQDQRDLQTAIEKYKFTIDELGPVLQKQQLDEQAKTLLNDWRLLVGAGIDVSVVNTKMADSINAYLQTAKRTGTEIPAAMRPILQTLIDQGKLVDENGNKFENLEDTGLTFAETMTQGFDRVVNALNRVLVGLGLIPEALDAIPDNKTIRVDVDYRDSGIPGSPDGDDDGFDRGEGVGNFAALGGRVMAHGIQRFAEGGTVLGIGGPRGRDNIPVWASEGETFRTVQQEAGVQQALASGRHDSALLAVVSEIRDALMSGARVVVNIENREVARANIRAWENGDVSLTNARELMGAT